jgi:integral membrane sensor domain MASE1
LQRHFWLSFGGGVLTDPHRWQQYLVLTVLNLCESGIAATLLRKRSAQLPRFTNRSYLLRFVCSAVLIAPLIAGSVFTLVYAVWIKGDTLAAFRNWMVTDALGNAIATPACVVLLRTRLGELLGGRSHGPFVIALVLVTVGGFGQSTVPIVFLIYPLMSLILIRFGPSWSAPAARFVTATSGWFTMRGIGPFADINWFRPSGPMVILQLYIASGVFMIFAVSTVVDNLRNTERKLATIRRPTSRSAAPPSCRLRAESIRPHTTGRRSVVRR